MSKPRIIILMHYLELGGAEMALLGLLDALDPEMVDIDLFVYSHRGPLMEYIPGYVNLLPEVKAYSVIEKPMKEALRQGQFGVVLGRMRAKLSHRKAIRKIPPKGDDISVFHYIGDKLLPFLPKINPDTEYDLCISFLLPHQIGLNKVKAKKKLAWIHTDYSTVSIEADKELPVWNGYDYIASISPEVSKSFLSKFPELATKVIPVENMLPADYIRRRAEEFDATNDLSKHPVKPLMLLSIGRYTYAKNYDNVPDITRRIISLGIPDVKWLLIGYGGSEALIRQNIAKFGMEEHVILLGKKDNPYPYIKACDIYVQPSRYEGKSITVREAQILNKPVIISNYPTAAAQVRNGFDGVIVPQDNQGCARGIVEFINDTPLQTAIISNLKKGDYTSSNEVHKIYDILNVQTRNNIEAAHQSCP